MTIFLIYIAIFVISMLAYSQISKFMTQKDDFTSRKTVTFGDESAVTSNRFASIISVLAIFLIWGAFTGSKLTPIHVPGPYIGTANLPFEAVNDAGEKAAGSLRVVVHPVAESPSLPPVDPAGSAGFGKNAVKGVGSWRTVLVSSSELLDKQAAGDNPRIIAVDGKPIGPNTEIDVPTGKVRMTDKGSIVYEPAKGWQMEPIWLPAPEAVWGKLVDIASNGYRNVTLFDNLFWSLFRVTVGFVLGSLVGIPLGYAMGLSGWFRGWFDPIVEFMRPVPPLALIPLIIIWFGIWETGKISLLFLAALWIMTIAARSGVSGVRITKVHAAYSLGASKWQLLTRVIVPNSLPDIFTGARVAMGVCWGTVVAAELVAAEKGAGQMIIAASKFQSTDIVIMGIILIGIIGFGIDILMRIAEKWLVPWKGKA